MPPTTCQNAGPMGLFLTWQLPPVSPFNTTNRPPLTSVQAKPHRHNTLHTKPWSHTPSASHKSRRHTILYQNIPSHSQQYSCYCLKTSHQQWVMLAVSPYLFTSPPSYVCTVTTGKCREASIRWWPFHSGQVSQEGLAMSSPKADAKRH
jgi:hypothetical protein